ncbi:MAG TPA: FHA domain-containing protein [Anaerolineae bacterium]|nr:FHA domain-containing protein [Anaerolineae bacterium]
MKKHRLLFPFFLTALFVVTGTWVVWAQTAPDDIVINFVAAEEQEEGVALDVFFTFVDGNGRPVAKANIESATIQLLGAGFEPVPVVVEDPQTPVYIALIIDTSGSMQNVIGDVRQAAISAIDSAPPTAYFSVIQFNETSQVVQDFTNDPGRVKNAIAALDSVPDKGTCLYDTLYDAVDLLDEQIQGQPYRRAIILFTDGKDQLRIGDDAPCSRFTYDDVINAARPSGITNPLTPIHTIGLTDAEGDNLNEAELRSMAADTRAFSAIGGAANLGDLFQEILNGLNSQLVARALLCDAQEGENAAVLAIKVRENDAMLTGDFGFVASREYVCQAPPPPTKIRINSLQYDAGSDLYQLSLGVANPETIRRLIINVWDARGGVQVLPDQIFENPEQTLIVELDASSLDNDRAYRIQVQAEDESGLLIEDDKENVILAEKEFTYMRPQFSFAIQSVNPDFESGQLLLDLALAAPSGEGAMTYEGFIVDESTGSKVSDFGPGVLDGRQVQIPLPEAMTEAEEPTGYRVTLFLITPDQTRAEALYEFTPIPPPKPGLGTRIMQGLANNPAIAAAIVVVLVFTAVLFLFQNRQKKKNQVAAPRPPVDKTNVFMAPPPIAAAPVPPASSQLLRLRVIQSPGASAGKETVVEHFPYIIGREGCDFNIEGDLRVSRRHLEITRQGDRFFVTDLDSSNGTYLNNNRLPAHQPTAISGKQEIRLGIQTIIELET